MEELKEQVLIYQGNLIKATDRAVELLKERKELPFSIIDGIAKQHGVLTTDLLREVKEFVGGTIDWDRNVIIL